MDTIFALATPPGRSGVAIIRVSGTLAGSVGVRLAGCQLTHHEVKLRWLYGRDGNVIDQALLLFFAGPRSFTGEDVLEIQSHGSPGVIKRLLSELSEMDGMRLAEAGEFSQRALINGKLSLTEVEGLSELLAAETESQVNQATRLMSGELTQKGESWREELLKAKALIEVAIDFTDEDIDEGVFIQAVPVLEKVRAALQTEKSGIARAERVRSGFEVAILGAPNTGKSTLLNQIARREVALVSEFAGTTRDILEAEVEIEGQLVRFIDTAGLRETDDPVEKAGVDRGQKRATEADLCIWLIEPGETPPKEARPEDFILVGKADSDSRGQISGLTGQGLDLVFDKVKIMLQDQSAHNSLATNERHRACIERAISSLTDALVLLEGGDGDVEIVALHLQNAAEALDRLTGRLDIEDVLGNIFGKFCIGK